VTDRQTDRHRAVASARASTASRRHNDTDLARPRPISRVSALSDKRKTLVLAVNHVFSVNRASHKREHTHTYTHTFNGPFPGLPGSAGTRKVKPIWILLKQETVSGSGISWAICKSAPRSRQITTPTPQHSGFTGRMPFLPTKQQRQSTEGKPVIKVIKEKR